MTGRGLGPAVVREFGTNYIFINGDVGAIVADPSASNKRSVSAFRKASSTLPYGLARRSESPWIAWNEGNLESEYPRSSLSKENGRDRRSPRRTVERRGR